MLLERAGTRLVAEELARPIEVDLGQGARGSTCAPEHLLELIEIPQLAPSPD